MTYKELDEILEKADEKQWNEFQMDRTLQGIRLRQLGGAKSSPMKLSETLPLEYKKATDNHYVDRHLILEPQAKHNRRCLNDPPYPVERPKKMRAKAEEHSHLSKIPHMNSGHPLTGHGTSGHFGKGPFGANIYTRSLGP